MAVLSAVERKTLNEYLEEHKGRIISEKLTAVQVASQVREVLKIDASEGNITARVGVTGRLYYHEWPGSEAAKAGRAGSVAAANQHILQTNQLKAWATQVYHVLRTFGLDVPPPPTLDTFPGLVAQANTSLADADLREPEERG
jgi:hypothetical protein